MIDRACDICGGPYRAVATRVARGRHLTCSVACGHKKAVEKRPDFIGRTGDANPNWKGGVSLGSHVRYAERFKKKNPEKVKAHQLVYDALQGGRLVRPGACSSCGKPCKPQAHHDDYSKPLEVRWLCVGCHVRHHHLGRKKAGSDLGALEVDLPALARQDLRERRHEVRS
jgi:hypothetical protein